jgi:hypothetical protein
MKCKSRSSVLPDKFSAITEKFPPITVVDFKTLHVGKIKPDFFDEKSSPIVNLDLNSNSLKVLDEKFIANLVNLQIIDLSWSKFKTLPAKLFEENSKLAIFTLTSSDLSIQLELPDLFLSNKKFLKEVYLGDNGNLSIPENIFFNSTNIEYVDFGFDGIDVFNR